MPILKLLIVNLVFFILLGVFWGWCLIPAMLPPAGQEAFICLRGWLDSAPLLKGAAIIAVTVLVTFYVTLGVLFLLEALCAPGNRRRLRDWRFSLRLAVGALVHMFVVFHIIIIYSQSDAPFAAALAGAATTGPLRGAFTAVVYTLGSAAAIYYFACLLAGLVARRNGGEGAAPDCL
jgi:hypothetical protein